MKNNEKRKNFIKDIYRGRNIEDELEVLYALSHIYLSMHVLNIITDECVEYSTFEHIKEYTGVGISARKQINDAMLNNTVPEEEMRVKAFINLDTLDERMNGSSMIGEDFMGRHVGWIRARFIAISYTEEGRLEKVIYAVQDINAQKVQMEKLLRISTTDELTGLYNRRAYETDLKEFLLSEEVEEEFTFVSIDVNGLKQVNDNTGHDAGDELLKGAASCMRQILGPYGRVYRIGGDEFVALLYTGSKNFEDIKKDFLYEIESWRGRLVPKMALSLGYASSKDYPEESVRELSKRADAMMYVEKKKYYLTEGFDRRKSTSEYNAKYNNASTNDDNKDDK